MPMQINSTHTAKITKRALTLFLLSVYLLFSVGIIKATHFCMGREASVQFFTSEAKKCVCAIYAAEEDSCCDDEHELLKIDDDHKTIGKTEISVPVWKVERIFTERLLTETQSSIQLVRLEQPAKAPPKIPLWKAHHSFVFYDDLSDSSLRA